MAVRILSLYRCERFVLAGVGERLSGVSSVRHFAAISNNPFKKKKRKVETTFKGGRNVLAEAQAAGKVELIGGSTAKPWISRETKDLIYTYLMKGFHWFIAIYLVYFVYVMGYILYEKHKIYKFSKKVAADLAADLGMDRVPTTFRRAAKSPGPRPIEEYVVNKQE